jgi:hypothetical protein
MSPLLASVGLELQLYKTGVIGFPELLASASQRHMSGGQAEDKNIQWLATLSQNLASATGTGEDISVDVLLLQGKQPSDL